MPLVHPRDACSLLVLALAITGTALPALADPVGHDCVLWLKADAGVTTDGGGRVTAATDFSGTGNHASVGVGSGPLLVPAALNGLPVMRFDGNWLNLAGQVLSSQQFTIVAVVNDTRREGSFHEVFSNWTFGNTLSSVFFGTTALDPGGPDTTRARLTDDVGGANQGQTGVGVVTNRSSHFIFSGISRTNNAEVFQNRTLIASSAAPISTRNLAPPYVIGRQGPISEFWTGDIAEILIYNTALSRCELDTVYDYFNGRYGLANCLPVLTSQPTDQIACQRGTVRLAVTAAGGLCNSNFTYRWSKGGMPLNDGNMGTSTISGAVTRELLITNFSGAAAGSYRCAVANSCGTVTSNPATIALGASCSLADIVGTVSGSPTGPLLCPDGLVDGADFIAFINSFSVGDPAIDALADVAGGGPDGLWPDGIIDGADFIAFINAFSAGC